MPKVSVIIPVYNVEPYLRECLDSVIHQTLRDIEIICIDDCSTDRSVEILEEYAQKDERIVILRNKQNSGLSVTRNRGIEIARGEYIQFVDSDDYMVSDALERLYGIAKANRLDFLKFLWRTFPAEWCDIYDEKITGKVYSGLELLAEQKKSECYYFCTWISFVRTQFLSENCISFFPGMYYEDFPYTFDLHVFANRCMCVNEVLYMYRIRQGSIMRSKLSEKSAKSHALSVELLIKRCFDLQVPFEIKVAVLSVIFDAWSGLHKKIDPQNPRLEITEWDQDTQTVYRAMSRFVDAWLYIFKNTELLNGSKLYVYGGGAVAEYLIRTLNEYDIAIDGVLVTDKSSSKHTLLGHRVRGVDEVNFIPEEDVVIVAVSERFQEQIQRTLQERNVKKIIPFTRSR